MEIHVVGREIVEGWRREEGWDIVKGLLGGAKTCTVTVVVRPDDVSVVGRGIERLEEGLRGDLEVKGGNGLKVMVTMEDEEEKMKAEGVDESVRWKLWKF